MNDFAVAIHRVSATTPMSRSNRDVFQADFGIGLLLSWSPFDEKGALTTDLS